MAHTPGPWEAKPTVGRIVLNGSSIYGVADITGEFAPGITQEFMR